jgi:hypothetical protein
MLHLYVFMMVGNFSQNVYVNVTSGWYYDEGWKYVNVTYYCQIIKMFM